MNTRKVGDAVLFSLAGLSYMLLFAPILVIVVFSFNSPASRFNLIWHGFTFNNWLHPFQDQALSQAFATSLALALIASLIATLLGGMMALVLSRKQLRSQHWLELLLVLPLTCPEIILATSLLALFIQANIPRGFTTLVISHSLFCLSYAALTLKTRLTGFDSTLLQAAMDLGATPLQAFLRVTLPLIAPGLLAAFLLSFSLSLDDTIISLFTAGETVTLPLYIAGAFQREISPQIHVLATLVLFLSVGCMALTLTPWRTDQSA